MTKRRHPGWPPPWMVPWLLAVICRLLAAFSGFGWFASDDYYYALAQVDIWLQNPSAPLADGHMRSIVFPRFFWLLLLLGRHLGFRSSVAMLQWGYAALGMINTLVVVGVYKLVASRSSIKMAQYAAYSVALFAIMPRIATRALAEGLAMVPLLFAIVLIDQASHKPKHADAASAGLLMGLAAVLRLHTLLIAPLGVLWLWRRGLAWTYAGGVGLAIALQAGCDWLSGLGPLQPWATYLRFNWQHASQFGVSPWYTYGLQLLLLSLPPLGLVALAGAAQAVRKFPLVATALGVFVVGHSLIGHKEDRFMFPILPLFVLLLAVALYEVREHRSKWLRLGSRLWPLVNATMMLLGCLSDGHRSSTLPFLYIAQQKQFARIASIGLEPVPNYYLRDTPHRLEKAASLAAFWQQFGEQLPDYVIMRPLPSAGELRQLRGRGCQFERVFQGDLLDRLLLRLNRHNQRRRPVALLHCQKAAK